MPSVLIRHEVADFEEWKPVFDEDDERRVEHGQQGYRLFRSVADENEVLGVFEFDSMDGAREFVDSEALREKMDEAGVKGDPEIRFLELVEEKQTGRQSA